MLVLTRAWKYSGDCFIVKNEPTSSVRFSTFIVSVATGYHRDTDDRLRLLHPTSTTTTQQSCSLATGERKWLTQNNKILYTRKIIPGKLLRAVQSGRCT